jgi:hypothetical protein
MTRVAAGLLAIYLGARLPAGPQLLSECVAVDLTL